LAIQEPTPDPVRAAALVFSAWLGLNGTEPGRVTERAWEAIELSRRAGDHTTLAVAYTVLGLTDLRADRPETAYPLLAQAQEAYGAIEHPWGAAMRAVVRSRVAFHQRDLDDAGAAAAAAVDGFRAIGDNCTLVVALDAMAQMLEGAGRWPEA